MRRRQRGHDPPPPPPPSPPPPPPQWESQAEMQSAWYTCRHGVRFPTSTASMHTAHVAAPSPPPSAIAATASTAAAFASALDGGKSKSNPVSA
ncbi:hypothetical protein QJS10_CPB20g00593 [Acorus calamus]|uniref:Uncharacterized protein n=1 Tax=Acorus calamus TaxID=4465 RepID=A0AAV9C9S3_ACOCL|nr:hypothetical protein QJS10_CPB20g00593 [Acorus calamus]